MKPGRTILCTGRVVKIERGGGDLRVWEALAGKMLGVVAGELGLTVSMGQVEARQMAGSGAWVSAGLRGLTLGRSASGIYSRMKKMGAG